MTKIFKTMLLFLAVFCFKNSQAQSQIDLPVTFDSTNVNYTMTDFGGNTSMVVTDPMNAANMVSMTTKDVTAQTWAGTTIGTNAGFASVIPFTATNHSMTVMVYSPDAGIPIRLKVEVAGNQTQSVETEAMTTMVNTWEMLTFNFDNEAAGTAMFNSAYAYNMASIFFNFGTDGATAGVKTYYFDNVEIYLVAPAQIDLPVTFDVANTDYTLTDFGGNTSMVVADPMNAANMVSMTTKDATAQTWAGTTIGTNAGFASVIPFTATNHSMTVMVYSPDAGIPVRLKAEVAGNQTQSVETEAMTTMVNSWEMLTFNFDNQAAGTAMFNSTYAYNMASIFFNFGTDGATAGSKTYYFDNVEIYTVSTPAQINLPVTFDVANTDYTMTDFGGNASMVVADPMNAANMVSMTTKDVTAQTWAGTTISTPAGFASVIPFTATNHSMTVMVYSPDAGIPVRLKAEVAGNPTQSVETEAMTTMVNTWEMLTFNFDNQAAGTAAFNSAYAYNMASIFFNFGTDGATAGTKTYYFDDVEIYTVTVPTQINLPVTFDVANTDYTMTDFGGNASMVVADPMNAANMVSMTTKDATAQTWAGTTIGTNAGFASVIPFTATNHSMTVMVYSPDAGIPVRLKAEVSGQPTQSVETEAMTTMVNTWEMLTFNFDNQAAGTAAFNSAYAYNMASIFFNFGTDGATAGSKTYYFDDVEIYTVTVPTQINLPVTFDVANTDYTMTDFGGNASMVVADPMNAANMVSMTTKDATAQTWAGTTIGTNAGFANVIPFTATNHSMTVMVYSPDAGIPVRLKAEVAGNPTQSVETEAMTTMVNTWEMLTFNFDNQAAGTAAFNSAYAYNMASIFFNFGTDGATAGSKTYYFDNVEIYTVSTPAQIDLPVTFDVANTDYTMTDFGGNASIVVADPMNAANMVSMTTKDATAQTWAGTTIGTNAGFASVIPFTATNHSMTVMVYSPDAGIPIRLKAEVAGMSNLSVETEAMTTMVNTWEMLTFNFDSNAAGTAAFNSAYAYNMASIFFNFGTDGATAGTKVYYFDNVEIAAGTVLAQINLPVTFDVPNTDYTMTDFGGNASVLGADPVNAANMVGIVTKTATAQTWAGTTCGTSAGFASPIPFTATNRSMTIMVYSPDAGIPIRLKVEVSGQPTQSVETEAMTTMVNTWEMLTFNFNNQAAGTAAFNSAYAYNLASVFFNFGTDGATAGAKTYYFDDVEMAVGSSLAQINLPVTFEVPNTDYAVTDFGGNVTVLGPDPMNISNTVGITTKTATAQTWAGTTIGTNAGFASPIPFTVTDRRMTVRVYSPDAGIPVRLKAEVSGQPTQSVETEAMTTVANQWEYLTFDFNNQAAGTAAFNPAYVYNMASIFFNFGTDGATAGAKTYLWDNVVFGGVPTGIVSLSATSVMVTPNPVTAMLTVSLPTSLNAQNLTFSIVDLTGRAVANGKLENSQINVSALSNGFYYLQITSSEGLLNSTFVKQ